MNDLKNKLLSLKETKGLIRDAIVDREVEVPEGTPFRDYANRIRAIPLGGAAALNIAYGDTAPADTSKLWVKGDAPKDIVITPQNEAMTHKLEAGVTPITMPAIRPAVQSGSKVLFWNGYGYRSHTDTSARTFESVGTIYDLETDTFSYLSISNQTAEYYHHRTGVSIGDAGFMCGGHSPTRYVYDQEVTGYRITDSGLKYAGYYYMDIGKAYPAAAAVGSKLFIFGGISRTASYTNINTAPTTSKIHMIDTEKGTVASLADTYAYGYKAAAAAVDEKIYLFGGGKKTTNSGELVVTDNIAIFDANTHEVTVLEQKLPDVALGISAMAVGSKIYLFGGRWGSSQAMSAGIWTYDTTTGELKAVGEMASKGETIFLARWKDYIYMLTGYGEWNGFRSTVDRLCLETELADGKMLVETGVNKNTFPLFEAHGAKVEVGIENVWRGNSEGIAEKAQAYLWGIRDILHGYEAAAQVNSGTELTAEVEAKAGQLVIAAIAARDSFILSAGWTLISESAVNSTDTAGQRLAFAYKYATADSESITVTQVSAQRLYINLVALDGATGYTDNGYTYKDTETEATISAAKPAGLTLWACVAPLWSSVLPYPQWKADNDPYRIDLGDRVQSRLAIFLDQSEAETVTFTAGANSTAIVGCLTIEGMAELYEGDGSGWCEIK